MGSTNLSTSGDDAYYKPFHAITAKSRFDDIPQWLKATVEIMHDKTQFGEHALKIWCACRQNPVRVSDVRATRRY